MYIMNKKLGNNKIFKYKVQSINKEIVNII